MNNPSQLVPARTRHLILLFVPALLFICLSLFTPPTTRAQSVASDLAPLPLPLSPDALRLSSSLALSTSALPAPQEAPTPNASKSAPYLTPEQVAYRDAIRAFGIHPHQLLRFEFPNGRVRTAAIVAIHDYNFTLREGILTTTSVSYSALIAAPQPVAAVGIHVANAFKWTGLIAGCVAVAPLAILVFLPLMLTGVWND